MERPVHDGLDALRTRLDRPAAWLAGPGSQVFADTFAPSLARIAQAEISKAFASGPVVIAQENHAAFLASTLAAISRGIPTALASLRWGDDACAQAAAQIFPALWLASEDSRWNNKAISGYSRKSFSRTILIPTGGTSGHVRWAIHTWATLASAARALDTFLGGGPFTHVSTLPPWHVSGLMPAVRALETGGTLRLEEWKFIESGVAPQVSPRNCIISLVPTQLHRLLEHPTVIEWLRNTRAILLGGAAPSSTLLDKARTLRLPIALAYGMTETAAVVAAQTPEDFLAGEAPCASPLPHAHLWITDASGEPSLPETPGTVCIDCESLFLGYYPNRREPGPYESGDEGSLDRLGRLHLIGRRDRVIITGGEKVDPAQIEQALLATGLVTEVLVIGLPDAEWGRHIAAIYTGRLRADADLCAALASRLPAHAIPKAWIHTDKLPLDQHGKLDQKKNFLRPML